MNRPPSGVLMRMRKEPPERRGRARGAAALREGTPTPHAREKERRGQGQGHLQLGHRTLHEESPTWPPYAIHLASVIKGRVGISLAVNQRQREPILLHTPPLLVTQCAASNLFFPPTCAPRPPRNRAEPGAPGARRHGRGIFLTGGVGKTEKEGGEREATRLLYRVLRALCPPQSQSFSRAALRRCGASVRQCFSATAMHWYTAPRGREHELIQPPSRQDPQAVRRRSERSWRIPRAVHRHISLLRALRSSERCCGACGADQRAAPAAPELTLSHLSPLVTHHTAFWAQPLRQRTTRRRCLPQRQPQDLRKRGVLEAMLWHSIR